MSGAVHQYRAPDSTPQAADEARTSTGTERDIEGKRVAQMNKGDMGIGARRGGGKGYFRDTPPPYPNGNLSSVETGRNDPPMQLEDKEGEEGDLPRYTLTPEEL